jgi:hypothetical protein
MTPPKPYEFLILWSVRDEHGTTRPPRGKGSTLEKELEDKTWEGWEVVGFTEYQTLLRRELKP